MIGNIMRDWAAVLIVASLAAAGGCQVKQPSVTVHDLKLKGLSLGGASMEVVLQVHNPNTFDIQITQMNYDLLLDGAKAAVIDLTDGPLCAASGTTSVCCPVEVDLIKASSAAAALGGQNVPYRVRGWAEFKVAGMDVRRTLDKSGQIAGVHLPRWRFQSVRRGPATSLEIAFSVTNPNSFAVPIHSISGSLKAGDQTLLSIDAPDVAAVAAKATAPVTLRAAADAGAIVGVVAAAATHRGHIEFHPKFTISPPISMRSLLKGAFGGD